MKHTLANEGMRVKLNQEIVKDYGSRLHISKFVEKNNKVDLTLDYRRIIHILDANKKMIYVRSIQFSSIYDGEMNIRDKLKLPLDELNKEIDNRYTELRIKMDQSIICNKKVIMPLIEKVPLFTAFLNKFNELISALVYEDIIPKEQLQQRVEASKNYEKYFKVLVESNYAQYDKEGNLKASNKLKLLHKKASHKLGFKGVIDEVLFEIIKENYDYIIHNLKLRILRTYVNLLSCLRYITFQKGINNISMGVKDLAKIYSMFYESIPEYKFREKLHYLTTAGLINKEKDIVSWSNL